MRRLPAFVYFSNVFIPLAINRASPSGCQCNNYGLASVEKRYIEFIRGLSDVWHVRQFLKLTQNTANNNEAQPLGDAGSGPEQRSKYPISLPSDASLYEVIWLTSSSRVNKPIAGRDGGARGSDIGVAAWGVDQPLPGEGTTLGASLSLSLSVPRSL